MNKKLVQIAIPAGAVIISSISTAIMFRYLYKKDLAYSSQISRLAENGVNLLNAKLDEMDADELSPICLHVKYLSSSARSKLYSEQPQTGTFIEGEYATIAGIVHLMETF